MKYSNIKPILALAALSFVLTLSQYVGTNPLANDPQSSTNTGAVEQSPDDKSQFDSPEYNPTAGVAVLLSAGIVVGILSLMKSKNSLKPNSTATCSSSKNRYKSQENIIQLNSFNHQLQNKLLKLTHGDQELAIRLISQIKRKNPDRPTNWCVEKVIYDLQRDHGRC